MPEMNAKFFITFLEKINIYFNELKSKSDFLFEGESESLFSIVDPVEPFSEALSLMSVLLQLLIIITKNKYYIKQ